MSMSPLIALGGLTFLVGKTQAIILCLSPLIALGDLKLLVGNTQVIILCLCLH